MKNKKIAVGLIAVVVVVVCAGLAMQFEPVTDSVENIIAESKNILSLGE